jgi:hypothetical protein
VNQRNPAFETSSNSFMLGSCLSANLSKSSGRGGPCNNCCPTLGWWPSVTLPPRSIAAIGFPWMWMKSRRSSRRVLRRLLRPWKNGRVGRRTGRTRWICRPIRSRSTRDSRRPLRTGLSWLRPNSGWPGRFSSSNSTTAYLSRWTPASINTARHEPQPEHCRLHTAGLP